MSDLLATAERLFASGADEAAMRAAGLDLLMVPESAGGFGGSWRDAYAVLRLAGAHCAEASFLLPEPTPDHRAFAIVAQIAGALDAALALSVDHANTRVQFGKPLAKLQAVQQSLAVFASEAAAANAAGQAAAQALDTGEAGFEIAAAKLRANLAAVAGVAIAHQVHGAIGFTRDHPLHRFTVRLSDWTSTCGNTRYWSERLGQSVCGAGVDQFWPALTSRSGAAQSR